MNEGRTYTAQDHTLTVHIQGTLGITYWVSGNASRLNFNFSTSVEGYRDIGPQLLKSRGDKC